MPEAHITTLGKKCPHQPDAPKKRLFELTGSCGIIDRALRRLASPIFDMSTPSRVIEPDKSSTIRNKAGHKIEIKESNPQINDEKDRPIIIELFPAPVLPTIPIFSPGLTLMETPFKTAGRPGR
jgi:hypothetical protein